MTDDIFMGCKRLKHVTFAKDSQLERIGNNCFYGTGIEEFLAPQSLRGIGDGAFSDCKNLRRAVLNEGLEMLGEYRDGRYSNGVFDSAGIK